MKKYFIIIFLTLSLIYSCQEDTAILDSNHLGKFTYQSYDSLGNLIVNGWLTIELKDSHTVEGFWRLENMGNRTDIGLQDGYGELIGNIEESTISINLNPHYADHNVYLTGNMSDEILEGAWIWTTFRGPTNWGTFKAIKD